MTPVGRNNRPRRCIAPNLPRRPQRGIALLTVLLLAAVMSALLVVVLDDIRFGLRRGVNTRAIEQARWHALGAEQLARQQLVALASADPGAVSRWLGQPLHFPTDQGMVRARLRDAGNCFNLNSVVEGAPGQWQRREAGAEQFDHLLQALGLGVGQSQALADALVDWIDSDPAASPSGAEDIAYTLRDPAYRTAGDLLAEPSELRAIDGFGAAYARLRPHVCAVPTNTPSVFNPDTMADEDAPLLVALTAGALPLEAARSLLRARPPGGWGDSAAFLAHPLLAAPGRGDMLAGHVVARPRWYGLQVEVEHDGVQVVMGSLLEDTGGAIALLARRWTPEE